tara:strand:- start:620 stop:1591 length:972 start_codon:yes stop_codon:yes gene_type:complete
MASPGRDVKLSEQRVKGYRNFLTKLWNVNNFLNVNKCNFKGHLRLTKNSLNINKWIYSELINTKNIAEGCIKNYRFDEASKVIYKFVWNSYCDWYLELSKTILFSKNKKQIQEVKNTSGLIFKEILILLHPFIPFITEELWLKNKLGTKKDKFLMYTSWFKGKKIQPEDEIKNVNQVIQVISLLRSFKNELNVSPGSFVDVSIGSVSKKKQNVFLKNEVILKKLGRINSIYTQDLNTESASLVISGEIFKIYFDKSVDLNLIRDNLTKKKRKFSDELEVISKRLDNKSFVERAPKHIVEQEKNTYNELKNDMDKINLTIKSLK